MLAVTAIVTMGFVYRWLGDSLVWYDEVASISLCWLTYYAGALAALRGAHIGFPGFVNALPANWRVAAAVFSSAVTIFFFAVLAVMGIKVVDILGRRHAGVAAMRCRSSSPSRSSRSRRCCSSSPNCCACPSWCARRATGR